jgi:hypothetical protein
MEEEMMEMVQEVQPSSSAVKVILLKDRESYLIGSVSELDEEPTFLIENCFSIVECAEYGETPSELKKRAKTLEGTHSEISLKQISETDEKEWWAYNYIVLERYPKFTSQTHLFLTSDAIFTILEPERAVLDLYTKVAG